jgi:hypothetical protein
MEGKCSTKGAYFCSNARTTSAGMIARDEGGKVLLTAWRTLKCCSLSGEAEAKACLEGMRLMVEWIRKPICVESNSSSLMQALDKKIKDMSPWAGILSEIQATGCLLPECIFKHTRREANQVAHCLAQTTTTMCCDAPPDPRCRNNPVMARGRRRQGVVSSFIGRRRGRRSRAVL